ncbi:MAG: aminomethyltransferase family protein [Proteobacteria bacterium]|nr:aminomethyltransferase family protein [Pseudomonadota bacterium]
MENSKMTVLHDWHVEQGANMALFGNYDMPLWYKTGAKAEHLAVIGAAGIFDTSHMAVVTVRGEGARALLQLCLSKDLETCIGKGKTALVDGRCVYGIFLAEDGTVIDDAILYQLRSDIFMVVVNAGMGGIVADHLKKYTDGQDADVQDLTDKVGKMDIQGPLAAKILAKVLAHSAGVFDRLSYFSFKGSFGPFASDRVVTLVDGTPLLVSRTGYTGEFGFELFVEIDCLPSLWSQLMDAGMDQGMLACGLAARDSLRAGAVLPLSHQDIGAWPFLHNPWQFALSWNEPMTSFSKKFIGGPALLKSRWQKHTLPFAGFDPRKINAGEGSFVTRESGERLGTILTCTTDMAIGRVDGAIVSVASNKDFQAKGLCCGFVLLDQACVSGEKVVLTDGKRKIIVEIRADVRPNRTARRPMDKMLG